MNHIIHAIQKNVQAGDSVKFMHNYDHSFGLVVSVRTATVLVHLFKEMDSATLKRFSLRPISAVDYPLASQD